MSGEPYESASYYFWKWADNDLPGPPREVHGSLLRGELHAALQPFDARPLLHELDSVAAKARLVGAEWEWQVNPIGAAEQAHFVFVTCPTEHSTARNIDQLTPPKAALGLALYDEEAGAMNADHFPKLNCIVFGHFESVYDVTEAELPGLVRRLSARQRNPFAILGNRHGDFVQCLKQGRRYLLEWRENYGFTEDGKFDQWRAFDPSREDTDIPATDTEFFPWSDMLRLFGIFIRGEPRPETFRWRNINDKIQ